MFHRRHFLERKFGICDLISRESYLRRLTALLSSSIPTSAVQSFDLSHEHFHGLNIHLNPSICSQQFLAHTLRCPPLMELISL